MGALGGEMNNSYLLHPSGDLPDHLDSHITVSLGKEAPHPPLMEQMRVSYRSVGKRALGMGSSFATLTGFAGPFSLRPCDLDLG